MLEVDKLIVLLFLAE